MSGRILKKVAFDKAVATIPLENGTKASQLSSERRAIKGGTGRRDATV